MIHFNQVCEVRTLKKSTCHTCIVHVQIHVKGLALRVETRHSQAKYVLALKKDREREGGREREKEKERKK